MPIKLWSKEELEKLRNLYPTATNAELAKKLGRSKRAIRHKATELRLYKGKNFFCEATKRSLAIQGMKIWSADDLKKLKEMYPVFPTREVARQLGRTKRAVMHRAHKFKIKKKWRAGMFGNNYRLLGETMEDEGISILKSKGWRMLVRGGYQTPYDVIMQKDGKQFAINIKYGNKFTATKENLQRLFALEYKPALFFLTKEGKSYFMSIDRL